MELKLPKNIDHCFKRNSRIDSRFQLDKVNIRNTDAQDIKKQLLDLCNQVTEPLEIKSHLNLIGSFILQGECLDSVSQQALLDFLTNRMKATRCLAEKHPPEKEKIFFAINTYLFLISETLRKCKEIQKVKETLEEVNKSLNSDSDWLWNRSNGTEELAAEIILSAIVRGESQHINVIMGWVIKSSYNIVRKWNSKLIEVLFSEDKKVVEPIFDLYKEEPGSCILYYLFIALEKQLKNAYNQKQGVSNATSLIEKLAEKIPGVVEKSTATLVSLFSCDNYLIRNTALVALSKVTRHLVKEEKQEENEPKEAKEFEPKQSEKLMELLMPRALDKSIYCRSKLLELLSEMNKDEELSKIWFIPVLNLAVERLYDKAVLVRRKACNLIESLLYRNDFLKPLEKIDRSAEEEVKNIQSRISELNSALKGQPKEYLVGVDQQQLYNRKSREELKKYYLQNYLRMVELFKSAAGVMPTLLKSQAVSDVQGSLQVVLALSLRGVISVYEATVSVLSIVSNTNEAVQKNIVAVIKDMFLNTQLHREDQIEKNLVKVVENLKPGCICALEEVFKELGQLLTAKFKRNIWKMFKSKDSFGATCVLRFICTTDANIIGKNYDKFLKKTLEKSHNWKIFSQCLLIIERIPREGTEFIQKAWESILFLGTEGWFPVAQQFLRVVYTNSEAPLFVYRGLAVNALKLLLDKSVTEEQLAKVLYFLTEVALRVVVHADNLAKEYKRQKETKEQDEVDNIGGGEIAQIESDLSSIKASEEKLFHQGVIAQIRDLLVHSAQNLNKLSSNFLKKSVVVSFGKMLCLNKELCEKHIADLLKIAQEAPLEELRCSSVVILGDIFVRQPIVIDQHKGRFFEMLKDPSLKVCKKALIVISHLVLNDMIKLRGFLGHVLRCYLHEELKGIVRAFLKAQFRKERQDLANMIPEALENLSRLQHSSFKIVVEELMQFFSTERSKQNILTMLASKLGSSSEVTNYAYWISLIEINEFGLEKLMSYSSIWAAPVLNDETANQYFFEVLRKATNNCGSVMGKFYCSQLRTILLGEEERLQGTKSELTN